MAQVRSSPGCIDKANLPIVPSYVKHVGFAPNPVLATVPSNTYRVGIRIIP